MYQGSERAGCQFSFACDGAMARAPSWGGWARAARVAATALAERVFAPVGLATHYRTDAVTPSWNRALVMTDVVGAHFFHRWKGYWGTAAAFSQAYRGGEPVPGPHAPPAPQLATVVPTAPVSLAMPTAVPVAQPVTSAAIVPAYRDSGTPLALVRPTSPRDDDQILPQWLDLGKRLRP